MAVQHLSGFVGAAASHEAFRWRIALTIEGAHAELRARYATSCGGTCSVTVDGLMIAAHQTRRARERVRLAAAPTGANFTFAVSELQAVDEAIDAMRSFVAAVERGTLQLRS